MNIHDATEQAYKNGYEAGYVAGKNEYRKQLDLIKDSFTELEKDYKTILNAYEALKEANNG